jgi:hypothetical protein
LGKPVYLFFFLVLLFACEEDINTLGFKSEQSGLKVYYAEIPIESSVLLMDSLRTSALTGEANRLLAGSYIDPVFGTTQAEALMHYRPTSVSTAIPANATFDSIVFKLRFDFYSYGTTGTTNQSFEIFEIEEELNTEDTYYFNSEVTIGRTPLATTSKLVNYTFFKGEYEDTDVDSVYTLTTRLDDSFGLRLFNAVNPEDVNYTDFDLFKENFKGLAIVPQQSDKIVGFNPADANSSLIIYYHDGATARSLAFNFAQGVTFSKITSDRSTTELSGLTEFHTDFDPGLKRYIQGGSSIVTKLDFSKFYEYMDTIQYIIINSAELTIPDVQPESTLIPPQSLSLTMLQADNRFKTLKTIQDTLIYIAFNGSLLLGDQGKFFAAGDQGGVFPLEYSSTNANYSGLPTLFFQRLFDLKADRYPYWALRPLTPQPGRSVDRVAFQKDNIKLKLYFTRATLDKQ